MIEATAALRALLLRSVVADQGRITHTVSVWFDPKTPNAPTMARSAAVGAFICLGFVRYICAIRGQNLGTATKGRAGSTRGSPIARRCDFPYALGSDAFGPGRFYRGWRG